jgi:hypothetical protein
VNVLENAIKYSPEKQLVTINLIWRKDTTAVVISDNGPGIPEEQRPFIFERFSRGATAEQQTKGFGLGLAIARKIAMLHNAKLYAADPQKGPASQGAEFHFEIKNI